MKIAIAVSGGRANVTAPGSETQTANDGDTVDVELTEGTISVTALADAPAPAGSAPAAEGTGDAG